jgi:hypothetical protein
VSDAPTPIPTDGVLTDDTANQPNWNAMPQRNRRRRRRGSYPAWLKYVGWCLGLAAVVTAVHIAYHTVREDPRDARVYAERELRLSELKPDERVLAQVSVWRRPAIDYFRATRGLLVVTDARGDSANPVGGRIIYLGLQPRDPLSPADAPPTFDERDWRVDTSVVVSPTRTLLYLARAIRIAAAREHLTVGVPSPASADADSVLAAIDRKYRMIRAVGWQRRQERRAHDRAQLVASHEGRRPWFHTVARGEALSSLAKMFGTTDDELRKLNGISGNTIKIGQRLRVKGWTKTAVAFPLGIVPDSVP